MGLAYFYGGSMADTKYISLTGLSRFLSKLKMTFASKDHAHDLATVTYLKSLSSHMEIYLF